MPLADPGGQAMRKEPAFDPEQIDALVGFVAALGEGPGIPEVSLEGADLSRGQELYVANCAPCHGATANGGAAGPGAIAPSLYASVPLDIAEAMITGPGEMPVFGFTSDERDAIISFIDHLQEEPAPGGADIGGVGPVPEGFVAWLAGAGALAAVCFVLGTKRKGAKT
jgi:ubiquinol-cytochrome c reductase cytochrome c subunit